MKYLRKFNSVSEMNTALASSEISILGLAYDGSTPVVKMKDIPSGPDYSEPFYVDVRGAVTLAATSGLQMSTDKTNWTDTTATTLSSGKTYFRVASDQTSPLKPNWTEDSNSDYDIGGNINSLVKVDFENDTTCYSFYSPNKGFFQNKTKLKSADNLILPATTLSDDCYYSMFHGCTSLTTAPVLPATTLANSCYTYMFNGCTSLTTAPVLPATTLTGRCYSNMFHGCTSLTTAPVLPATTLAGSCYNNMFHGCTSLTTAPVLPATTLATGCYGGMFHSCTSLTTAPVLPATTLANNCYNGMFNGCTSLTTAPVLPATTLATGCYSSMFNGCTKLNYIKCLATDISASDCIKLWTRNISSTGTFVKDPNMSASSWGTGANGIPSGWTVEDATA